jgi:hypothetical protein
MQDSALIVLSAIDYTGIVQWGMGEAKNGVARAERPKTCHF